jgi:peptidoglycan/LPS O-acetylase OafA/YrhL
LTWVGRRSYGLYLWHVPVFRLLGEHPPGGSGLGQWGWDLVRIGSSVAVAAVSYRLIEGPALRLKARLRGGREAAG